MKTSVKWLNSYLSPGDVTPEEADHVLTHVGFPIEERLDLSGGDVQLDVELTSNRGDCLCHVGLAREIAASTGRTLRVPGSPPAATGPDVASLTSVVNQVPELCPMFTARLIRGVTVGPSPEWLVEALESIGQRSINNIVDISNYVLFELGHPNHTFDFDALSGGRIVVRKAAKGEKITALDELEYTLLPDELVVADDAKPVSIAGVIGGHETRVTESTKNVLIEVATWDPVTIRNAARRMQISTDAAHRFERYVDARDIEAASQRIVELILDVAGGELCDGVIAAGGDPAPKTLVDLRLTQCERILGIEVPRAEVRRLLETIGLEVGDTGDPGVLRCTIPHHRHDLTREIDLIEEVARLHGFEHIHVTPKLNIRVKHPQESERATRLIADVLTGMGFYETVTVSFLTLEHAAPFTPGGLRLLKVDEDRRKENPYLRPSILPSLLSCRKANQDAQVNPEGGVRLFEIAAVFAERDDGDAFSRATVEHRNVALLADAPAGMKAHDALQHGVRMVRGALDGLADALGGEGVRTEVRTHDAAPWKAYDENAWGSFHINGELAGTLGVIAPDLVKRWDLDTPVIGGEVNLDLLLSLFPPASSAHPLPAFPGIERDLSLIVNERTPWGAIAKVIDDASLERLVGHEFVTTYRGKQIGAGLKSVTMRLRFRDPERTLRHEEVDPQMQTLMDLCRSQLEAEIRA